MLCIPWEPGVGNNQKLNYYYNKSGTSDLTGFRKPVRSKQQKSTTTQYRGQMVHQSSNGTSSLKYIITSEGRLLNTGTNAAPVWGWEYDLKDHLGNVRVMFKPNTTNNGVVRLEYANYFPFGMKMLAPYSTFSGAKYLYNGKEYQDDFGLNWYDYGARFYDAAIGRFHTVDPMAEDYYNLSPYSYCAGNPIVCRDENGEWINFVVGLAVGGSVEYISQVAANVYDKGWTKSSFTDVDVSDIGLAMIEGAVTSGASAIRNTAVKTAVKIGTEIATEIGQNAIEVKYNIQEGSFKKDIKSATEVTVNTAIGLTAGKLTDKVMPKGLTNGKGLLTVPNKKAGITEARNSGQRLTTGGRITMENKNISKKEMNKSANNQLKQSVVKTPSEVVQNKLKIDEKR